MPELYLIIAVLLFVLAILDLVVGVSNDAVNFLNSAIGSKVAPRHIIMIVASIGIFVGATFSSGMMEVARKGIFNPQFFFFGEIMIMFLAVMLTDIMLLDLFNTFGLPTSTTVSIVFELLGAAVAMSFIKIIHTGESLAMLGEYINSSQAILIIGGIFLSVAVAFLTGVLVMFVSRMIFSFRYRKKSNLVGSIWSGLAMAAMTYFLLFKGIKGASFVTEEFVDWIKSNMLYLFLGSFVLWTGIMQILAMRKVNVFRLVVLFGTFALAMAFAGNDLVNFIGVPIAGFESFLAWRGSGVDPFSFSMDVLQQPVRTKTYLLVIAGVIMIVTLWLSKKARSVTDTEVNLGRQSEGHERFSPNLLARGTVRYLSSLGGVVQRALPSSWLKKTEKNFQPLPVAEEQDKPAFDMIRASVNLTTASVLIAFATSLKLPLSTTYVSFMVAMGTSLADRAWGRNSAVYRVAGVFNVIGGWFATAIIAFTVSGLFTLLIYHFGLGGIVFLVALAVYFIYRSFSYHKKQEKKNGDRVAFELSGETIAFEQLFQRVSSRISSLLETVNEAYSIAMEGLIKEDAGRLNQAESSIATLVEKNEDLQYELYGSIKRMQQQDSKGSKLFLYMFDLEQDIVQSVQLIVSACSNHVKNSLSPLQPQQVKQLEYIGQAVHEHIASTYKFIDHYREMNGTELHLTRKQDLLQLLEEALGDQVKGIKESEYGARNSQLMFKILLETKDVVALASRFMKLYKRVNSSKAKDPRLFLSFSKEKMD